VEPAFQNYLFELTKKYNAKEIKRFNKHKRYALTICFLLETRKVLLDHLVKMHDQYVTEICRKARNAYEKKHRELRQRQKKAVDTILYATHILLNWSGDEPLLHQEFWRRINRTDLQASSADLQRFQQLTERGYGDLLLARYPSLRKYFADFIQLPFVAGPGSEPLMEAIELVRELDADQLKQLPANAPTSFVPKELRRALIDETGNINRNAWEMGLALAIKDALRSGDLYLPQSKQHVSFWDFMLGEAQWQQVKDTAYTELQQPQQPEAKAKLTQQFQEGIIAAKKQFNRDKFAQIENYRLKLNRDDKAPIPDTVTRLQRVIDTSMPPIRIEQLLMEVDRRTGFSRHFTPIQGHHARPKHFYKTLMATLISQATNLGVVSMSASVKDLSVDMLRHALHFFVREETLTAASAEIVNQHHQLPLSAVHGSGNISSSDAQRFGIRASSLLASYYPRYYGYYQKAIGIYTHVSDQYSVFSTKVISCSPREALYVLDGLLENNTILQLHKHTTDTHGYTELIFALCYLLGYEFMPRIRDLKDQQLYRVEKNFDYGVFTPLLNKTADIYIVEEQWDAMMRVALSLKQRTVPAHIVVQRLLNSFPADRLSKAFTNLGRIIKTQYILRYLTDPELRTTVQRQLNKGEYRHKLPRRIFFADQGEFTTGDYEEIMNKASCLSLVSNAILYWNTIKINDIIESLRQQGEDVDDVILSHISLLPFRHVLPNGTYFIDDL
jgi:TnpA family transposase